PRGRLRQLDPRAPAGQGALAHAVPRLRDRSRHHGRDDGAHARLPEGLVPPGAARRGRERAPRARPLPELDARLEGRRGRARGVAAQAARPRPDPLPALRLRLHARRLRPGDVAPADLVLDDVRLVLRLGRLPERRGGDGARLRAAAPLAGLGRRDHEAPDEGPGAHDLRLLGLLDVHLLRAVHRRLVREPPRGDAVHPGAPRLAVPPGHLVLQPLAPRGALRAALARRLDLQLDRAVLGAARAAAEAHAGDPRPGRRDRGDRLLAGAQRADLAVADPAGRRVLARRPPAPPPRRPPRP